VKEQPTAILLTQEELESRCTYWQKVLRLQDWDVHVRIARQCDFNNEEAIGECRATLTKKTALIYVLDPVDFHPASEWPQDMEEILVHELLHLHFDPFWSWKHRTTQEQAIQCIATGLVRVHREARTQQEAPTS
jgi:hypothetical protein